MIAGVKLEVWFTCILYGKYHQDWKQLVATVMWRDDQSKGLLGLLILNYALPHHLNSWFDTLYSECASMEVDFWSISHRDNLWWGWAGRVRCPWQLLWVRPVWDRDISIHPQSESGHAQWCSKNTENPVLDRTGLYRQDCYSSRHPHKTQTGKINIMPLIIFIRNFIDIVYPVDLKDF